MAIQVYLIPFTVDSVGDINYRAPLYLGGRTRPRMPGLDNVYFALWDYGAEPLCILGAEATAGQHNLLSNQVNLYQFPENLDTEPLPSERTALQAWLESRKVPADWIVAGQTFRQILRILWGMFQYMQRLHGTTPDRLFAGGVTLDSTFGSLPSSMQLSMIEAGVSLGYPVGAFVSTDLLRTTLKKVGDLWGNRLLILGGIEI